jgi:hypothetical protein
LLVVPVNRLFDGRLREAPMLQRRHYADDGVPALVRALLEA